MKTIGLACSGGGLKATCNLGVIKAFKELGIPISAISGTSIGSCVAILYALGYSIDEMEKLLKYYAISYPKFTLKDKILTPFRLLFFGGAKNPKIITKTIEEATSKKGKHTMNELDIPVFIPALDITTKETVYYTSREIKEEVCFLDRAISEAVKSSCSLPFLYLPNTVYMNGILHQFSDGGMTTNTPTTHLNEFADIVVGVEIKYHKKIEGKKVNLITGIRNTFQAMRRSVVIHQKHASDIWIQVDTKNLDIIGNQQQVETCIKLGYDTVINMAKEGKLDILLANKISK